MPTRIRRGRGHMAHLYETLRKDSDKAMKVLEVMVPKSICVSSALANSVAPSQGLVPRRLNMLTTAC